MLIASNPLHLEAYWEVCLTYVMFSFNGRINGKTYYIRVVVSFLLLISVGGLHDLIPNKQSTISFILAVAFLLSIAVWAVFLLSQIRQRANDIGYHPLLITLIAWWTPLFLVLGLFPGQKTK